MWEKGLHENLISDLILDLILIPKLKGQLPMTAVKIGNPKCSRIMHEKKHEKEGYLSGKKIRNRKMNIISSSETFSHRNQSSNGQFYE